MIYASKCIHVDGNKKTIYNIYNMVSIKQT